MAFAQTDVLIIGGGVVGGAIAYNLAKNGVQVALAEKAETVSAASGSNGGQLSISDREPGCQLAWALRSLDLYEEFRQAGTFDAEVDETGGLFIFDTPAQLEKARPVLAALQKAGLEAEMLQGEEILRQEPRMDPASVAGALYCPREGRLNPFAVGYGFLDGARENGAKLFPFTEITGFLTQGNRLLGVQTTRGDILADTVVMATAAWTKELAGKLSLAYPIGYDRANVFITQPMPPVVRGAVAPGVFLTGEFTAGSWVQLGVMQHHNGSMFIAQSTRGVADYNTNMAYEEPCAIARLFIRHFPSLAGMQAIRMWSGVTPCMPDEKPLFGFSSRYQNLFMAAGLKGAFSTAPAAGEAACQLITGGKSTIDCGEYSPARFE